jgi:hypothetical protein
MKSDSNSWQAWRIRSLGLEEAGAEPWGSTGNAPGIMLILGIR